MSKFDEIIVSSKKPKKRSPEDFACFCSTFFLMAVNSASGLLIKMSEGRERGEASVADRFDLFVRALLLGVGCHSVDDLMPNFGNLSLREKVRTRGMANDPNGGYGQLLIRSVEESRPVQGQSLLLSVLEKFTSIVDNSMLSLHEVSVRCSLIDIHMCRML